MSLNVNSTSAATTTTAEQQQYWEAPPQQDPTAEAPLRNNESQQAPATGSTSQSAPAGQASASGQSAPTGQATPAGQSPQTGQSGQSGQSASVDGPSESATQDAVAISGSNSTAGTSLPTQRTPDGKAVLTRELHQGREATVTREQTQRPDPTADDGIRITNDQVVFTTNTQGDAHVRVSQRDDGTVDVNVNGESYEVRMNENLPNGMKQQLTIRTGAGNDIIEAAPNVSVNLVVDAGAGDDQITTGIGDDQIFGGDGNDTIRSAGGRNDIDGGRGDDVIHGGSGANVIYGGQGNDQIFANGEFNYIDGGRGDDVIHGNNSRNILSAGNGNDQVNLAGGNNTVYAGAGASEINGAQEGDRIYAKTDDLIRAVGGAGAPTVVNVEIDPALGRSVQVTGSDAFRDRMESEMDFLRASPNGQAMLGELDAAAARGNSVIIRELGREHNGFAQTLDRVNAEISNGRAGTGSDVLVSYNPTFHADAFPAPNVVLFHELSHAYNGVNGTFQPGEYVGEWPDSGEISNAERQATGLETSNRPFDFDNDPSTPPTTHNPIHLTENGMRREMGLPDRTSYIRVIGQ